MANKLSATNLEESVQVQKAIDFADEKGKYICAICAAPQILGHKGLLKGKEAIAYPGFEAELTGAEVCDAQVVTDGNITTAKGMGAALDFANELVSLICGEEKKNTLSAAIMEKK